MTEQLELYRCTACGYITSAEPDGALGTIHAHVERHARKWGVVPAWLWPVADPDRLDRYVEHLVVDVRDTIHRGGGRR